VTEGYNERLLAEAPHRVGTVAGKAGLGLGSEALALVSGILRHAVHHDLEENDLDGLEVGRAAQWAAAATTAPSFGFRSRNTSANERANTPASTRKPVLNARISACVSRRAAISA